MAVSHTEMQVLYARYLKSGMTLEEFCKKYQILYWDMSEWINQWEKLHGARFVENSTTTYYKSQSRLLSAISVPASIPPPAQKLFPLEFSENQPPLRTPADEPPFRVNLELPKPGTIIKGAKLTFPNGMTMEIPQTTIKGLILMAILYEGNDIGLE